MLFPVVINMSSWQSSYFTLCLSRAAAFVSCIEEGMLTPPWKWPKPSQIKEKQRLFTYLVSAGRGQGQGWQKVGTPLTVSPMKPSGHCSQCCPVVFLWQSCMERDRTVKDIWRCCLIEKETFYLKTWTSRRVVDARPWLFKVKVFQSVKVLTDSGKWTDTAANKNTINDCNNQQQGFTRCSTGQNRRMSLAGVGAEVSELPRCSCQPCFELHVPEGKNPF